MPSPEEQAPVTLPPLSKEEIAFLIKALWSSLQAPGWTFKSRKDLENLGEAIFSGKTLRDVDDSLYDRIFPHLVVVATHLGDLLRSQVPESPYHEIAVEKSTPIAVSPPLPPAPPAHPTVTETSSTSPGPLKSCLSG
jgi:hypothetical protein